MGKVGRPSKYAPEVIGRVDDYLKTTGREHACLPTIEGFALFISVNKDTLYEWKKKYPEFSDALEKLMLRQVVQLIDDGIYGGKEVNATIIKLMLQNNHGMKERADQTTNDKDMRELVIIKSIPDELRKKYDLESSTENNS